MEKAEKMEQVGELFAKYHHLHEEYGRLWLDETFLHWDWLGSVFLAVDPWIFWIFYRRKESTHRLYALIFLFADWLTKRKNFSDACCK